MAFSQEQIKKIQSVIKESLLKKFKNYKPETSHMPFHYRLLGKDRMALFSFILLTQLLALQFLNP